MPPGFEHRQIVREYLGGVRLITVSMPPGFEHAKLPEQFRALFGLITVSMPPGFEHSYGSRRLALFVTT